ncbi:MAG: hypothetical protein WCE81_01405, partial [Halobacteriota archaeon]
MGMKKAIISLSVLAILTICMFNNVAAAPVSKQTPDVHSNYAVDARGRQQTYILAMLNGNATTITMEVGQSVYLHGVLSSGTPPTSWRDS